MWKEFVETAAGRSGRGGAKEAAGGRFKGFKRCEGAEVLLTLALCFHF
jgi:hypothetical protein